MIQAPETMRKQVSFGLGYDKDGSIDFQKVMLEKSFFLTNLLSQQIFIECFLCAENCFMC